jgi:hypothetical protein
MLEACVIELLTRQDLVLEQALGAREVSLGERQASVGLALLSGGCLKLDLEVLGSKGYERSAALHELAFARMNLRDEAFDFAGHLARLRRLDGAWKIDSFLNVVIARRRVLHATQWAIVRRREHRAPQNERGDGEKNPSHFYLTFLVSTRAGSGSSPY